MAFPQTPIDATTEIFVNGAWEDISSFVYDRDGITISRGRQDEASQLDPSSCRLTLDNVDGRFSPRNPTGPYYGQIGRNTPIRVAVNEGLVFGQLTGADGTNFTCPDSASTSVTGDIDIRIEFDQDSNPNGRGVDVFYALASKYNDVGNQRAWAWWIDPTGIVSFRWSTDGTVTNNKNATSSAPIQARPGRRALRVTMDVDSGGGTSTVTFYTAETISGPWAVLGSPVVRGEVTSIFDSSEPITVGEASHIGGIAALNARVYKFELRSGIAGTAVANPDFTAQTAGATSFADTASPSNTWSAVGAATITNKNFRFHGEVSAWPQRWDMSGKDVYVPLEAAGVLRRLGQGAPVARSALYRVYTHPAQTNVVAYWPCEDAAGTNGIGSAFTGHSVGTISGSPEFAADDSYPASAALPKLNDGRFVFNAPNYTVTSELLVRLFVFIPAAGVGTAQRILTFSDAGSAAVWEVNSDASAFTFTLQARDAGNQVILTAGPVGSSSPGVDQYLMFSVALTQVGADINYSFSFTDIGDSDFDGIETTTLSGTLAGNTFGKVTNISVAPDKLMGDSLAGHVVLATETTAFDSSANALVAWAGETAGARAARLCEEESTSFVRHGLGVTQRMGPQSIVSFPALLQECADADQCLLFEPRERLGIGFRDRDSLVNQPAQLALTYSSGHLSGALDPVDDDQLTRNDVTVNRTHGSSARATLDTGALSTLPPPSGIGRYDESITQNLQLDTQLPDAAGWRLHLGTADESRYPAISVNLADDVFSGSADRFERAMNIEQGGRVTIDGLPTWLPPDAVSQLVQGQTEQINNYGFDITYTCSPESPYHVAVIEDTILGHADTAGSQLNASATSAATSLSVTTTSGPIWTTDAGDFPFDIRVAGERMTVTNITGAASPQTFTVTRSVNGVVKAQASGADVRLWEPMILSL